MRIIGKHPIYKLYRPYYTSEHPGPYIPGMTLVTRDYWHPTKKRCYSIYRMNATGVLYLAYTIYQTPCKHSGYELRRFYGEIRPDLILTVVPPKDTVKSREEIQADIDRLIRQKDANRERQAQLRHEITVGLQARTMPYKEYQELQEQHDALGAKSAEFMVRVHALEWALS